MDALVAQALSAGPRFTAQGREISFDDYVAFATAVARLSNHARPPFRPMTGSCFKL